MALFEELDLYSTVYDMRGYLLENKPVHAPLLARVEKILANMERVRAALNASKIPAAPSPIRLRYFLISIPVSGAIGFFLGWLL